MIGETKVVCRLYRIRDLLLLYLPNKTSTLKNTSAALPDPVRFYRSSLPPGNKQFRQTESPKQRS